ncbi:major capsid protein [Alteromonadaceae bacterium M269]|nr:major capsid protein [Alteromonadaceae bacterium M269]
MPVFYYEAIILETIDPFSGKSFTVAALTAAINHLPNAYGNSRPLFSNIKRERVRTIMIEERNGVLTLINSQEPGGEPQQADKTKRKLRSFVIPHFPLEDVILPSAYSGIRGFGTTALMARAQLVADRLQNLKASHDITHEYLRMGAKKGLILDADGSVLYNLFTEFGITKQTVYFDLSNANSNVPQTCRQLKRLMEESLRGEVMRGVTVEVSPEFMDKLISHKSVKEIWAGWQRSEEKIGGDPRERFPLGGLVFKESNAKHYPLTGQPIRFVSEGKGHAYPEGTMSSFFTAVAPADFNETVNTLGQEYYAKIEARKMGRGYDLHSQSNVLPMCARPGVLIEVDMGPKP